MEGREAKPRLIEGCWHLDVGHVHLMAESLDDLREILATRYSVSFERIPFPPEPGIPLSDKWTSFIQDPQASLSAKREARNGLSRLASEGNPKARNVVSELARKHIHEPAANLARKLGKPFVEITAEDIFQHVPEIPLRMAYLRELSSALTL